MNAVQLHADWRPTMGLTPDDAGTLIERVLASVVIEASVQKHNADVKKVT